MSLAESATTAVRIAASSTATNQPGGVHEPWQDQLKNQWDLYTQLVISSVLGLGAFLSFCMDGVVCSPETTTQFRLSLAGIA
jgi:Sec7-like guanine-nucleotide exchange factor